MRFSRCYPMRGAIVAACFVIGGLASTAIPAAAADNQFQADLGPIAHDNSTRAVVEGRGSATATLSGHTLTVTGTFSQLPSNATTAHLMLGLSVGVPVLGTGATPGTAAGSAIGDLTVTAASSGDISGSVTLTSAQLTGLRKGALYIVVGSVKAPDGNLWGWFQAAPQ